MPETPKFYLDVLNQVFELEKKAAASDQGRALQRHIDKIKLAFDEACPLPGGGSLSYHNPVGEPYSDTRTDCEVSIAGTSTEDLVVVEVIKPIIYLRQGGQHYIVQRGIVIAASRAT